MPPTSEFDEKAPAEPESVVESFSAAEPRKVPDSPKTDPAALLRRLEALTRELSERKKAA